ncbi:hypothetical protein Cfor_04587, partial [Coptotermes formosanus]
MISLLVPDSSSQMEPLTVGEYQRILAVLQRDAVLRMRERQRISKLHSSPQAEGEAVGCQQCETSTSGRECAACVRRRELKLQSGDWFYRHIQSRFSRNTSLSENSTAHDNGTAMEPESAQVREFIERLVEALVSGQLDDVKLNRLYTHPEYDRMFAYHHSALCENLVQLSFALQMAIMNKPLPAEETPSAVHAALKQRVQRVIQEAMTLPNLKSQVPVQNGSAVHKWNDDITSMTYEDILATAILNKVIEQFQQRTGIVIRDTVDGNHNLPAASSMEGAHTYISQVEIGVNNHDDCDTSSQEGLRSWSSELSHTEPLSMTIEQCIEEQVMTYDSAGEEDEDRSSDGIATTSSELDFCLSGRNFIKHHRVPFPELGVDIVDGVEEDELSDSSQPTDLISPVDSWEENWLFQRRRLKAGGTADSARRSPMPVPMLVPNPSEEFRARIGDRDAEEVSDLSDCSDGALEDVVLGRLETNMTDDHVPKVSVMSESHDVSPEPPKAGSIAAVATEEAIEAEVTTSASTNLTKAPSVECLSEFGQQDSEYTEDYASVTQRQMGSLPEQIAPATLPVPKPRTLPVSSQPDISPHKELLEDAEQDTELSAPPRPGTDQSDANCTLRYTGTIAEREHRKWESAPPLPNNPYSPENINKRLSRQSAGFSSRSSSVTSIDFPEIKAARMPSPVQVICTSGEPDYKRYGRDYYINQSKLASGERRASSTVTSPILQQVCDTSSLLDLEQQALHRCMVYLYHHGSFRASHSFHLHLFQSHGHVESEVAKWQKEIDQTEQQWLKKLQHSDSVESAAAAG